MSFIAGALIIGAGASLVGGAMQSRSASKGIDAQTDASDKRIALDRETRDLIRSDQEPYRKAGNTALSALMDLTGLPQERPQQTSTTQGQGNTRGAGFNIGVLDAIRRQVHPNSQAGADFFQGRAPGQFWRSRQDGGDMVEGEYYVVNEMGPEDRFQNGEVYRNSQPTYMQPGEGGYVKPNGMMNGGHYNKPVGRFMGGAMGSATTGAMRGSMRGAMPDQMGDVMYNPNQNGNPYSPEMYGINPVSRGDKYGPVIQYGSDGRAPENPGGREGGYQFQADPGYNFRFQEGNRMLERGAAARGGLLSGGFARKAIRYGQDYASNEYGNVYNRIANIAGLGQTANSQNANAALVTNQSTGNALTNAGMARASGYVAQGNAWGNAINSAAQLPWNKFLKPSTGSGNYDGPW